MSERLWVEYKTERKVYKHWISFKGCEDVDDFIKKIRNGPQLGVPKGSQVILCTPSGAAIEVDESPSSLLPGNSSKNPLRIQVPEPPLIPIKSASHAKLTSFWNSLHYIKNEKGFLHFPVRLNFFPENMKSLYIRKAYEDLFQIICNNLNSENETKERFHRMAITGTPGTGKSMFLFYILWRLANRETTKMVILRRQMNHECIYVFRNDGCWITCNPDYIGEVLRDPTAWYLTDDLQPPPNVVKAITILVTSPVKKSYSKFLEYFYVPPLHYLPIWSLEELKLAAKSHSMPLEEVENRFNVIGGIPRYVLEKNEDLEELIRTAIEEMSLHRFIPIALGEGTLDDQIGHRIVHFYVEPSPCYTRRSMIIASEYVKNKVLEKYIGSREEELKLFLAICKKMTFMKSVYGNLFEAYTHEKLSVGKEFLM
jgi:hypothetical protein